jgi:hypothetical protein
MNADMISLLTNTTDAIHQDLTTFLTPLPNVVFLCKKCSKVWNPVQDIIWACVVAIGATFSAVLTVVTFFLRRLESWSGVS